jgi:hypothetical protein
VFDGWAYPAFSLMRAAVKDQAELIAVSYSDRTDLTYGSDQEMEKAYRQFVSGWMFGSFGLRPALGRLFTESDDMKPGAHPYAVLSYDYWARRFGRDPKVIGRTFRMDKTLYQIVGVAGKRFTGTEPGTMTDIFIPTLMHPRVVRSDSTWLRTLARVKPEVSLEPVRAKLEAVARTCEADSPPDSPPNGSSPSRPSRSVLSRRITGSRLPIICARWRGSRAWPWPVRRCSAGGVGTISFPLTERLLTACWLTC